MSKAQLGRLIDLPDDDLQQVLDYAATLSKADAADHFANLLGSEPAAVEFVAAFNSRRHDPAAGSASAVAASNSPSREIVEPVPKHHQRQKKKKAGLHTPPARQVTSLAPPPGAAYNKKNTEDDYIWGRSGTSTPLMALGGGINRGGTPVSASTTPPPQPSPQKPHAQSQPQPQHQQQQQQQQQQRSAGGGSLIQDALAPKTKNKSSGSGGSNNNAVTKISITGGTAMHGASTALSDFDAAIRSLEVSTNPTLSNKDGGSGSSEDSVAARRCNCVATRHPLQTAAPNCQSCGKVICVKEGLGPCTSCGAPLLSPAEVQAMIKELRAERGREKMAADREAHRRVDVNMAGSKNKMGAAVTNSSAYAHPQMIAGQTKWGGDNAGFVSLAEAAKVAEAQNQTAEAKARAHRDKLLSYQAQNAQRTTVRDEAADFDVGDAMANGGEGGGGPTSRNLWATPEERARELRRQQKVLREMEWNARPEYEKRQQVLSIDVTGRKVFRKVVAAERPPTPKSDEDGEGNDEYGRGGSGAAILTDADGNKRTAAGGAFSKNPLLGHLIKPVYDAKSRAKAAAESEKKNEKNKDKDKGKDASKGKGKGKVESGKEETGSSSKNDDNDSENAAPLPGRGDDPNAASRWRRVQDDLNNNEAVILDGGVYGKVVPPTIVVGDEPDCG